MPRTRRHSWLNYPHLVIAQANGGAQLFADASDFESYLLSLRQLVRDRLLRVLAYCLMEDEIRLVVIPSRLMLSRIMQRLHVRHSCRMNAKLDRVGHLFRGRFRSLVFDPEYILDVVRSVHLWPVRLGRFRRAELYPYSSHAYYVAERGPLGDFLSKSEVLDQFSGNKEAQLRAFDRFIERSALEVDNYGIDEIFPGIGGNERLGNNLVKKAQVLGYTKIKKSSVNTLAERVGLLLGISLEQLVGISRRQELVMARRLLATAAVFGASRTVTEVAIFLHKDKAQVSRLVAQGMDLLATSEPFLVMYEALKARGGVKNIAGK